jgi:MoaA/NifB/PqqE/SkfB family radical SAM enzyme
MRGEIAYSALKAAWHVDKIAALRRGEQVIPAQVQLIISDLCNQDCHFCAYRMSGGFSTEQFAGEHGEKNPNRTIPTSKCYEILEDCKTLGVQGIQFTGGGEPTVHKDHLAIFSYAQRIGLKTALVTNGNLLREGWDTVLPYMDWVRVSIDAGSAETYAKVRNVKPSIYAHSVHNVGQIAAEIARKSTDCLLGVGYVVTRENYAELARGVAAIRDTGAAYVRISAMFSTAGEDYYSGAYEDILAEIEKAKELETPTFSVVNLFGNRISDLHQHSPDYEFCGYQQFNCYIGGNLKVYRCCTTSYTKHGEVGDLSRQRFADWFYSQTKRNRYELFNARSCHTCQFNDKNRVINYMVSSSPIHAEFV